MMYKTTTQIGEELGLSRQYINTILKMAYKKMYKKILKEKLAESPYFAFWEMINLLGISSSSDIKEFYNNMPEKIKEDIKKDAETTYHMQELH